MMKVIGITGGIGSGKSTVSSYLKDNNYVVMDMDQYAKGVTAKGSPALDEIAEVFGSDMITEDGELDRKRMASVVFSDAEAKNKLERIVTDRVYEMTVEEIERYRTSGKYDIIFMDAPILFETGSEKLTDFVWFVTARKEIRIRRVMERDGVSAEDVEARMASQMPEEVKAGRSDEIIDNSGGITELTGKIGELLEKYAGTV